MSINKKDMNKLANIARDKNVMIEITEDGRCIRIYPEFNSRDDASVPEDEELYEDIVI